MCGPFAVAVELSNLPEELSNLPEARISGDLGIRPQAVSKFLQKEAMVVSDIAVPTRRVKGY
jgi:hypothetical protein